MKLSKEELVEVQTLLKAGHKFLARDKSGSLYAYDTRPKRDNCRFNWISNEGYWHGVVNNFNIITWDEGPVNLDILVSDVANDCAKRKLTLAERALVYNLLEEKYKFIARDYNGALYAYKREPIINIEKSSWNAVDSYWHSVDDDKFEFVTWDEGPVNIAILINDNDSIKRKLTLNLSTVNDWIKEQVSAGRELEFNEYGTLNMSVSYSIDTTLIEDMLEVYGIKEVPSNMPNLLCAVYKAGCDTQRSIIDTLMEDALKKYNIPEGSIESMLEAIYEKGVKAGYEDC